MTFHACLIVLLEKGATTTQTYRKIMDFGYLQIIVIAKPTLTFLVYTIEEFFL